jgi:hypothetical protein
MGTLDGGDTIHLDETEIVNELQQAGFGQRSAGRFGKPLPFEEDLAGLIVRNENRHGI